jgi:hypothetical protein
MVSVLTTRAEDTDHLLSIMVGVLTTRAEDTDHLLGIMVSVLTTRAEDCGFDLMLHQIKDNKIGICCFSAKHAALSSINKDWLAVSGCVWA